MDVYLEIAGSQIDGARDYQEDAFLTTYIDDDKSPPKSSALIVMADGMGGHAAGNIASNLVVSTFNKHFTARFGDGEPPGILRDALDKANDGLRSSIRETPALDGMGCTMVTVSISRGRVWWVSVGDSHLYVIRDRELTKKNEDHSYGGYLDRMKAQGMDVQAEQGLSRNMLMSAITGEEIAEIDCPNKSFQLLPGDRLIIASDGLDTLSQGTILQTSLWSPSAKECVDALLKAVEDAKRPRQDNTTVVVCDVIKRDAEPIAPPKSRTERDRERETDDTQPMNLADIHGETTTQPGATTQASAAKPAADKPAKRGKGPVIGIAVAVLLAALGTGGWFMFGGGKQLVMPFLEAAAPEPAPEPVATGTVSAPEPEPVTPEAPTEPVEPQETVSTPVPMAEPIAEPVVEERTFRDPLKSGGEGPLMVRVPAGRFLMGLRGSTAADQRPEHPVDVGAFAISAHEVTFAEYDKFVVATRRKAPNNLYLDKKEHPAFYVSWYDALAYVQWLGRETGTTLPPAQRGGVGVRRHGRHRDTVLVGLPDGEEPCALLQLHTQSESASADQGWQLCSQSVRRA